MFIIIWKSILALLAFICVVFIGYLSIIFISYMIGILFSNMLGLPEIGVKFKEFSLKLIKRLKTVFKIKG